MHLTDTLKTGTLKTTQTYIDALKDMDIRTIEDLLLYLPRAYEDLSEMRTLDGVQEDLLRQGFGGQGEKITVRGSVTDLKTIRTRKKNMTLVQGVFTDTEGNTCDVIWFNQPHVKRMLEEDTDVVLSGKIVLKGKKMSLQSPTFESGDRELLHAGRIVSVYPQHDVINTKWLREKMALIKDVTDEFKETLPSDVVEDEDLPTRNEMILELHFPETGKTLRHAKDRLAFEELYKLQLKALTRKREWQTEEQKRLSIPLDADLIKAFFATLKFTPTDSQRIAIYEILKDLEKTVPMSRLLEGDVGSGKTLVATAVIANVIHYGGQCALMVPTEVLAKQHAANIQKLLKKSRVALLTGSMPESEKNEIKLGLARGTIDIVVGTHALIQSSVSFKDLRLAIVDEQHRFGVQQRKMLKDKGSPHFLSMTATPIPRTLALTAYGDHDLSVLLEKPGNRKSIKTKVVAPKDRRTIELFIDKEIDDGRQVYVICPLISESNHLEDVKNVTAEAKYIQEAFPKRTVAMLHGKLTPAEKDEIMRDFKEKKSDILVSTTVIEVGIDVPNVSIILIEGSERFGLSQLHQLRGRVGRADHQSYCFLCTTERHQAYSERLKAMEKYDSGFQLAEIDLKLRGPGELYGTRQSGIPEIRVGSLVNPELVMRARRAAEKMISSAKGDRHPSTLSEARV